MNDTWLFRLLLPATCLVLLKFLFPDEFTGTAPQARAHRINLARKITIDV